ncbi:TPA: DNA repair and recombination protein RadB [Candidatus Woesearchaeota archaeon]|nr:DNA repair and recombination protein RadB [Candidatus Woesearchaeota archaeon]HII68758.1 DNA repair and recombination protein RadB [Candidatus Woesearchaeota archaeon]
MIARTPTGSRILDSLLAGGYENDIITTIYGPAGSGKTILAMLCATQVARSGKKVIYIDTEGSFSPERLSQVAQDHLKVLDNMVFFMPLSFAQQKEAFDKLRSAVSDTTGLIVVDSIAMLYRIEAGRTTKIWEINRALGEQISFLTEIARKRKIPVLITNQVYANFEKKNEVMMVGGDLLRNGSKCLLELQITAQGNRKCSVRKHRSIRENRHIFFRIVQTGILGTKEETHDGKRR